MITTTNVLLTLLIVGIGVVIFLLVKSKKEGEDEDTKVIEENARLKADLSQKDQKLGEINKNLKSETSQKDEFAGKNKQMFAEITDLKAKLTNLTQNKDSLAKELADFKAEEKRKAKEFETRVQKLDEAKNALEDEKKRIRREDEEREQREKEERDRMWAEHEEKVKSQLAELCKSPQLNFPSFDNKNLPEGFSGKFKPDFLIEFLEQYVIFDAKVSRSDNLQNYIKSNVKSTVEKINNDPKIYPMIFFIVPNEAMEELSQTHFYEKSYQIFVVAPESLPVILAAFKKISTYELAEQMDPRERENIVSLIAEFDYHINMRNALDLLASQSGVEVLKKAGILNQEVKDDIKHKKSKMKLRQFTPTDMKNLMIGTGVQQEVINEMTSPQAQIPSKNVDEVEEVIFEDSQEDE
ncbi:hypothetical protein GF354_05770 [Candidatus Peregrinibacteria bacterium]|nr:hypothetical protein [Candidatus Peregrinibacteria bacterium]